MQKICAIILLTTLALNHEALPQAKWSRPIRNSQGQLIRERRQFPFGEWIPLSQPCPTCRPFADPLDVGLRGENIGLTPPRPPTVTRQIHGEGNFFPQDESSILSVPPPPPSAIPRHPVPNRNGNFQFSTFGQFSNPIPVPTQQIQFLPQTFLQNQPLLVNGNQHSTFFGQEQTQKNLNNGKINGFNAELKTQKLPENVVLEQNKAPKQAFSNKPQPFAPAQQIQQQAFLQQQHSVGFGNSILTPPPAPKNVSQDIVIPGLDKEEIQLLYVPVESLRQRGTSQEQLLTQQQPQNIQFFNRGNNLQRPVNNIRPTEQTLGSQSKGYFVTQNKNSQGQTASTLKVTSTQAFPTTVSPPFLLQQLPFQQTPQPFVSATPATPTLQSFVTPASVFGKFSSFAPETTFSHLSTVPNNVQFSQSDIEFGTTPKTIINQEILNGKSQFSGLKSTGQEQARPFPQPFVTQQQVVTQQPQLSTVFSQQQQEEEITSTHFPFDQQQIALQKQQEHQRLLQQQRQKDLEEQRILEQQRKQKELEEQRQKDLEQQRFLQKQKELEEQRQKELEQQKFLQKQKELEEQRQKELEHQRFLQKQKELEEQRQKELEHQRYLQKQKELEEQQRLLAQQRQKELEQQRYLQKQKELEEQRLLQQRQKELEQQRFLQKQKELDEQRLLQQRQRELQEQRFLQEQKQRELENQRRLQLQKQKELEDKRRLQLKQKEDEQRLLRFQQQQKELEQQRLLQQQQEEQQRILQLQKLAQQKQENLKKQQQFQFFQQQQLQQQQKQTFPQQVFQQQNRHVLPTNDKLNFIPQLEKESEQPEDQQLVPHQPPLSVFFRGLNGVESRITDVLRELRSSNTITVLDQYFEKMPKVFVGPAGLIPPDGYQKFELPYLSNIESNRFERRIGSLPFFVAPLNFVPPTGYAKIPFPAPHIGSVVVSSESNPAMTAKPTEKGAEEEENVSGGFPVVGPELPGLINNLDTITTTVRPTTYLSSTPSLPQTTAQLRNRRPNSSLYKPQSRKPITRTRPTTTTSKPEEEVTQPIQKVEISKDNENGIRKPFNRFLNRRRPVKTTTENPYKSQQGGKSLENRHYSVEVYHQEKNQLPRTQPKSDLIQDKQNEDEYNRQVEYGGSIDRITPGGHEVLEVRPTPDFSQSHQTEVHHPEEYSDVNLQTFEDGPLPTGSAKTITQELYRPNTVNQQEETKTLSKLDSTPESVKFQVYEDVNPTRFSETSDASPTAGSVSVEPTSALGYEKQDISLERYDSTEASRGKVSFTPGTESSGEQQTKGFLDSNEQYTSAFAEISKPHHIPGFVDSTQRQQPYPTSEIAVDLQAPYSRKQTSQENDAYGEVKPTQNSGENVSPTGLSNEQYYSLFEDNNQQSARVSQVSPTAPGATEEQYTTGFSVQAQNSAEANRQSEDERISVQDFHSTVSPQQYYQSSTSEAEEHPVHIEQNQLPSNAPEVTINPSVQTYTAGLEGVMNVHDHTQTTEGHDVANKLPTDDRLKLSDPSIVRIRTRLRGKSRGQVNFSASQTTTPVPFTRSGLESTHIENSEEHTTKGNNFRDYKTSKYGQFRGVKKPVRTTTESTTEEKVNVYTIRPQRRPLNPSTVSTKRIRRPTTPLPSVDTATETYGISTAGSSSQSEHTDISPSGVSNDVYYEQNSLSPVKHKFRKHFGSAEQKSDVVPTYLSTSNPTAAPTYTSYAPEDYSEEFIGLKGIAQTESRQEKYPEWNPSESGFDVSGIVLTTVRTPGQEDEPEEEPKKLQDSKKAFDPDLEKKTGRRRVRVRVHKRPHENFETAESQNLRTVANVLVPPTTTYKPNDESSFHQLAKNSDFSFGGQKFFGSRSREYFRKRLNLTHSEEGNKDGEQAANVQGSDVTEKPTESKFSGFFRKAEKDESGSTRGNESSEGGKVARPKFRGFVRKIIKHGGANKTVESRPETEGKLENTEYNIKQSFRTNHTERANGTRHKTFVRYVKKNKIKHHETESVQESQESQKEDQGIHQTTESFTRPPAPQETSEFSAVKEEKVENQSAVSSIQQRTEKLQHSETTEEPEVMQSQTLTQATQTAEAETSSQTRESSSLKPATPLTQVSGLYLTQRNKFYQTLRPIFQRTTSSELKRIREPESTTEHGIIEPQEKRNGIARVNYGKTTEFESISSEKSDEIKKVNEQQIKNKTLHTLEVRKYLRTKNREGAFSQFSKNKYYTSEKTDTKEQENIEDDATEKATKISSANSETTQAVVSRTDSLEVEGETTENKESENQGLTTESITSSEEESSEEDVTDSAHLEATTETDILTTAFRAINSETPEKVTQPKPQTTESVEPQRTEYQPDIYRFSKNSFSFDETEKFTGTKNRAHVRNITTDIIENTASFSAPGVEKRPEIRVVTHRSDEQQPAATELHSETTQKEKTEVETTESSKVETTTEYPEAETTVPTDAVTKDKIAKVLKTSTTTKISHETEICYRGKCIRTKSDNADDDLKKLVDSASTMKIEKTKT